jgi:hypothetical protein
MTSRVRLSAAVALLLLPSPAALAQSDVTLPTIRVVPAAPQPLSVYVGARVRI